MVEEADGAPLINRDNLEIQVEIQRQINQLGRKQLDDRAEVLDHRAQIINWWLAAISGLLTLVVVGLTVLGFFGIKEFRQLNRTIDVFPDIKLVKEIRAGTHTDVPLNLFIPVTVASGQIAQDEITRFIDNAHNIFADAGKRNGYADRYISEDDNRWEITIDGGGAVQIFRTKDKQEFLSAWNGVLKVLQALKDAEDLPGIKILVRGTERFFDIKGIGGVGGRTWIAFDLR